jgi:hypothetical protein
MDKEERKEANVGVERAAYKKMQDPDYWFRRAHWDEWGSPVGLALGWALFIVPLGLFLWLLHLANLIG